VVTQFMNYAKPYAVSPKLYDINGIIEKAVEVIRVSGLPEGIAVETELHPGLPQVYVDGEQMKQVILNIAFNGIEAMPDGGTLLHDKGAGRGARALHLPADRQKQQRLHPGEIDSRAGVDILHPAQPATGVMKGG
jgi:nitrogen-specific signal transduction histidine kinase